LGLGFSVLTGNWSYEEGTYWVVEDSTNIVTRTEYSMNGMPSEMTVGLAYDVSERVSLGARGLFPMGDFDFTAHTRNEQNGIVSYSDSTHTVRYPSRFGLGVQYRPRNEYMPRLMLEGEYITYSDYKEAWDDVFEIRTGVEQQVVRGVPVRAGFSFAKAPDSNERALAVFSTGIGFQYRKLVADFGMEVGKINYTYPDLFPNTRFGGARVDVDRVETGLWRGIVSVRYDL
jgi:long-subunit fatty acid transport protein